MEDNKADIIHINPYLNQGVCARCAGPITIHQTDDRRHQLLDCFHSFGDRIEEQQKVIDKLLKETGVKVND